MIGEKKPVMVYIHGGSYVLVASADPLYSGQYLVAEYEKSCCSKRQLSLKSAWIH